MLYYCIENSVEPDQLASDEASWSGSTPFLIHKMNETTPLVWLEISIVDNPFSTHGMCAFNKFEYGMVWYPIYFGYKTISFPFQKIFKNLDKSCRQLWVILELKRGKILTWLS